jgi:hypothetical protein
VDAIAARDPVLAVKCVTTHIKNLGEELISFLGVPEALLREKEDLLISPKYI